MMLRARLLPVRCEHLHVEALALGQRGLPSLLTVIYHLHNCTKLCVWINTLVHHI